MSTANDSKVSILRVEIEKKRDGLKSRTSRFSPVTNCSLELNGRHYNLHILDRQEAMLLASQLQGIATSSAELLFDPSELAVSGYSVKDWLSDTLAKIESITVRNEEVKLRALDAKLKELLSSDAKTEIALKEIAEQLV